MNCLEDFGIKMFVVIGNTHLVKLGEKISKKMQVYNFLRFCFICGSIN